MKDYQNFFSKIKFTEEPFNFEPTFLVNLSGRLAEQIPAITKTAIELASKSDTDLHYESFILGFLSGISFSEKNSDLFDMSGYYGSIKTLFETIETLSQHPKLKPKAKKAAKRKPVKKAAKKGGKK